MVADGPWSSERYEWFGWKNLRQYGIVFNQVEILLQNRWYIAEDRMPIADEDTIWIFFLFRLILEQIVPINRRNFFNHRFEILLGVALFDKRFAQNAADPGVFG